MDVPTSEEKEFLENLGRRIKELRRSKGYSNYEHFAFENNISRTQYGKYETGENMKILNLLRVLKGLDISISEFFNEGFE
ncbi:helix-turn-helix transcriptional regulator [Pontibacter sp. G13]|uniref:helix-turn-helix domain-containing protein n=1 Tax=Pontibacter sp. G13 TaxID=3074898 RepID=UPI00288B3C6C|nr:helix-turn-helix transcriptional regulator [Pontibacter sp. G13]WNJ17161.1 helix-turn-helix transcriptional regulator [Pontibacter sp. G13]